MNVTAISNVDIDFTDNRSSGFKIGQVTDLVSVSTNRFISGIKIDNGSLFKTMDRDNDYENNIGMDKISLTPKSLIHEGNRHAEFDYEIIHKIGKKHINVDMLSKHVMGI